MQFISTLMSRHRLLLLNTSWMLGIEVLAKVTRILTIVALAAGLGLADYGTVMLALICHEVIKLLLRAGAGSQIIQCERKTLRRTLGNGMLIQWILAVAIAAFQALIAIPLGYFYGNHELTTLLQLMAPVYLFYPLVADKVFLMQRANNMRTYSVRNGICIVVENLTVAGFALSSAGMYAIVAGKWLFVLAWVALFINSPSLKCLKRIHWPTFKRLTHSSTQLVGTELSRALRVHMDILLAAKLLPADFFGMYSFAKNAGVGLTNSIVHAYNGALYPYLCKLYQEHRLSQQRLMIAGLTLALSLVFVVQALMVPVYVPILFDERWDESHITTALLCLVALPAVLLDSRCLYIRAQGGFTEELRVRFLCICLSILWLLNVKPDTPELFASTLLQSAILWLLCIPSFMHLTPSDLGSRLFKAVVTNMRSQVSLLRK